MEPEPLCDTGVSEEGLVAAVVEHYRQCLVSSDPGREALVRLGISVSVAKRFSLGLSDRSLGLRLPERNRSAGKHLRESLIALGIYRSSGHEHFVGSLVVPVGSPGGVIVGLCARRTTDNDDSAILFASGMAGGIFNEGAVKDEVVLTESVFDALAAISAGCEATLAPGRPAGFTRADLERLAGLGVRRAVLLGDRLAGLKDRLGAVGIEAVQVACGRSLHGLLASSPDASQAIASLLGSAASTAHGEADEAETAAVSDRKVSGDASELHVSFARRRWRVRGAERNKVPDTVRVSLLVSDTETGEFHLDALDLCVAKARAAFVQAAGAELHADEAGLRRELAEVLFATESILSTRDAARAAPEMTEEERDDALELLRDPGLTSRVIADLNSFGVVGEETNLLVAYLATISRISEHPFGVVVQSSSAAGKSTLADAVCQLVPEEDLASYSTLTGQALYYLGAGDLSHKVLAVSEQQGAARALYALKLLLTEGRLAIASTGKDPASGRLRTRSMRCKARSPSCSRRRPPSSTPSSPTASSCSASTRTRPRRAPSMPPSAGRQSGGARLSPAQRGPRLEAPQRPATLGGPTRCHLRRRRAELSRPRHPSPARPPKALVAHLCLGPVAPAPAHPCHRRGRRERRQLPASRRERRGARTAPRGGRAAGQRRARPPDKAPPGRL